MEEAQGKMLVALVRMLRVFGHLIFVGDSTLKV